MSITETLAFIYICSEADTRTGIWKGSASALSGELGVPDRTARDVLERMERGGYIRRFPVPGRHACYPILIHKFLITDGEHNGEHLNAIDSKSPGDLMYFAREHDVEGDVEHGVEHSAAQKKKRIKKETEEKPAAKPAPPADPRFQPFFQFAYESFARKHSRKPIWQGKDRNGLKNLLRNQSAEVLPAERLQTLWRNFLSSTEAFTAKQGDSLAYFCSNLDKFSDGPIMAAPQKGANHEKRSVGDKMRATLAAYRTAEQDRPN